MSSGMVICLLFVVSVNIVRGFHVGERVVARWTNNHYYGGKITNISLSTIDILYDDNDRITHRSQDVTAVLPDEKPNSIKLYDHVIAPWPKESYKQYIGFVVATTDFSEDVRKHKVLLDNGESDWYTMDEIRILPQASSPHDLGARVYARWPRNRAYYRGFVGQTHSSTIFISYDDGDEITHPKNDASAVILDKIPQLQDLKTAQKVIASWRDSNIRYYPGHFSGSCPSGVSGYKYLVKFDDADKHDFCDFIYQIRTVPEICA